MAGEAENFKKRLSDFTVKLREQIQHFEPASAADWATNFFHRGNSAFYGKIITIVLCSYFLSDLTSILVGKYLPEAPPVRPRSGFGGRHSRSLDDYNVIMARNLFNSNGVIPGEENSSGVTNPGGVPVRTSLPFNLIGTMILRDELHSIATIEDKGASQVYPVRIEDEIPQKAKITKIEPRRVIFVNESNHHLEFVELPETAEANMPKITLGTKPGGAGGIEQVASNQFIIPHAEVDRALADLNNILTQARAVPNFENGQPAGYKLFQIVPGSIYQKLGIQEGDVICGFDGAPANDPAAAFEKLSNLKNSSHMDLCIKRGGKQQSYSYDFR